MGCLICDKVAFDARGGKQCGECNGMGIIPHGRPRKVLIVEEDFYGFDPIRSYEEDCPHCKGTGYCPHYPPVTD